MNISKSDLIVLFYSYCPLKKNYTCVVLNIVLQLVRLRKTIHVLCSPQYCFTVTVHIRKSMRVAFSHILHYLISGL